MGFYSVWPSFLIVGVLLLLVWTPPFKIADIPPIASPNRDIGLDGVRGFLALGVVFQHLEMHVQNTLTGKVGLPPSHFYSLIGQAGTAVFFMITGYLFWGQMLRSGGKPAWLKLYVGRIFRIVPLYWVLCIWTLVLVAIDTSGQLLTPVVSLLKVLLRLAAGGVFYPKPINGDTNALSYLGVTWTLHFEWLFYASLLVTALLARRKRLGLGAPFVGLVVVAIYTFWHAKPSPTPPPSICILEFAIGMCAASIKSLYPLVRLTGHVASFGLTALLVIALVLSGDETTTLPILLLGSCFLMVVFNTSAFGLLHSTPARRLGDISYGIYLLQVPVVSLFSFLGRSSAASPLLHWCFVLICLTTLMIAATLAHRYVELPGIRLGKRIASRLDRRRASTTGDAPRPARPELAARRP